MPYANNQGVHIHYEVEGEGPPLVLVHGTSGYLGRWRQFGYVDALKGDYQLILIDARGHGQSDKPHNPDLYRPELMVGDVVAVLDDLGIGKAHYFGYSLGGWIGFHAAKLSPDRFHSLIVGGQSPYRGEAEVKASEDVLQRIRLQVSDPEAYIAARERLVGRTLGPEERALLLANDAEALIALYGTLIPDPRLSNDDLSRIALPCLVYAGGLDLRHAGAKEAVNHMPNATFVSLPGLDHSPAFERIDVALPHIKEFLAKVSKAVSEA